MTIRKRQKVSKKRKQKVWRRDGNKCTYCQAELVQTTFPYDKSINHLTVDHVVPSHRGGTNGMNNLTTACRSCNKQKRDLLLTEFIRAFEIKLTPAIARFL